MKGPLLIAGFFLDFGGFRFSAAAFLPKTALGS
jgi:hypothetical protein